MTAIVIIQRIMCLSSGLNILREGGHIASPLEAPCIFDQHSSFSAFIFSFPLIFQPHSLPSSPCHYCAVLCEVLIIQERGDVYSKLDAFMQVLFRELDTRCNAHTTVTHTQPSQSNIYPSHSLQIYGHWNPVECFWQYFFMAVKSPHRCKHTWHVMTTSVKFLYSPQKSHSAKTVHK